VRIVREAAGAESRAAILARIHDERAAMTLAAALGGEEGTPSAPEVAWAFRRFCEALAAERPLLLLVDDVHWAEPTLLELLEQLAGRGRGPMLLVLLAREELREEHPGFLGRAGQVVLDALSTAETAALVEQVLAGASGNFRILESVRTPAGAVPIERPLSGIQHRPTQLVPPGHPTIGRQECFTESRGRARRS
jgi:hypothetical protein